MFVQICKMSQKDLKKFVVKQLGETHNKVINKDGFVFAQGTFPVLLVAHLDTVHKELPKTFEYDNVMDVLSSPQGIGGDDRCGVYMIFEVLKKYNCSVLFCEDEEIGCVGAEKFTKSDISKNLEFNYIIEFDRRGKNDAVFYECANDEFEAFITKGFYKSAYGSFSDISTIAPHLGCAAVNLSCGYYNAHTNTEYVVLHEMQESIEQACKILERTTADDKFEYIEDKYEWDWLNRRKEEMAYFICWYNAEEEEDDWMEINALSEEEAIGIFLKEHPTLTYNNIEVYCDEYINY